MLWWYKKRKLLNLVDEWQIIKQGGSNVNIRWIAYFSSWLGHPLKYWVESVNHVSWYVKLRMHISAVAKYVSFHIDSEHLTIFACMASLIFRGSTPLCSSQVASFWRITKKILNSRDRTYSQMNCAISQVFDIIKGINI